MSYIVTLVFVLVASMIDRSEAISCYQCNYTRSSSSLYSSCGGAPFNPNTNKKCSGQICSWQLSNYASSYIAVQYDCLSGSMMSSSDLCAQYRSSYTVFNYGDSCCYKSHPVASDGTSYDMTSCFCQTDDCNGEIPETVGPSTSTPTSAATSNIILMMKLHVCAMTFSIIAAIVAIVG